MNYKSFTLKYKPKNINNIIGQNQIKIAIKNIIKNKNIPNSMIFSGQRGTGKTTIARIIAKSVNCKEKITVWPCNICKICISIEKNNSIDIIEINAANNTGIDNVRSIIENANYKPIYSRFKFFIIDEIHMFSINAFNALLKILEDTPDFIKFILITTEIQKIPITVLSRCQHYVFKNINISNIIKNINKIIKIEKLQINKKSINFIAKKADGSARESLILLEQAFIFSNKKKINLKLLRKLFFSPKNFYIKKILIFLIKKETEKIFKTIKYIIKKKCSAKNILEELIKETKKTIFKKINSKKKNNFFAKIKNEILYKIIKILLNGLFKIENYNNNILYLNYIIIKVLCKIKTNNNIL